ncbi:GNAT family N-acetyltransferase [Tumebacillus sp. ITR2]|uniref:GNAT family N-acetyltransferase n=1 Tax=Tumebacillus amylolyticus TaxID=2801339 RepID=A0ABS1J954_9BACL|nr:GNAT family protein [Tumebacillus amylolyticus]MBL0386800.1 GNAT family N-acetyltransferase [Tumebacillus amylolyticus]
MLFRYTLRESAELRLFEEQDAQEMYELLDRNRAHLREWLPFVDNNRTSFDSLTFIKMARRQVSDNQGGQFAILWEGKIAGVVGFHGIDWGNRMTSIGYWLGQEYTGLGLMTLATDALCKLAFEVYNLNRVEIKVATENYKSQAVAERLGFTREGVLRQREWLYDHWVDHIVYSKLASEWKKS